MEKAQLLGYTQEELTAWLRERGQPAFRARQLFAWLHQGVPFAQMSNLPGALRESLGAQALDNPVRIREKRVSALDGTVKFLFSLHDGHCVEGVLMHYRHGHTLCVSTQVGCRMGCAFCASTLDGCVRNLTAAEMLGQILCANRALAQERVGNMVLMGSGEPLDNYDNTLRFLRLARDPEGLNIGIRHISLSTCGLTPKIRALAQEGLPVTLSVSLHAPNDAIRKTLMPVARVYPMDELLDACRFYIERTGRRAVFEYALVRHVNSTPEHARELAARLRGMQCHVNLIPLNSVPERALEGVDEQTVAAFLRTLEACHISATRRREMGDDIQGACGQLRRSVLEKQAAKGEST